MTRSQAPPSRTAFERGPALAQMCSERFDVLVVGGGITGAGVALDAAARGLRTALVERRDFGSGTSSQSSKLIHGGLRYLQQRDFRLVYEALAERQRLLANAPHLVRPLPFLIPLFAKVGVVNDRVARAYSTALWLYDATGGLRIGERHQRVDRAQAGADVPALDVTDLVAGFRYWDAWADDARLTLTVLRTAVLDHGAVAANHAPVVSLLTDPAGRVAGACLEDGTEVRAAAVVNAAGVWSDDVRSLDEGAPLAGALRPAKGVHLTFRAARLAARSAAVLPVPGDHRTVFVVPWGDRTYVGTTDTDYDGPLDEPRCNPDDVDYVLRAVNRWVRAPLDADDIVGMWAGLRPLVRGAGSARTADLSRRHRVTVSANGLVSVTGGKLTTYRRMAADTVDEVVRLLGRGARRSPTRRLALRGAAGTGALRAPGAAGRLGIDTACLEHLVSRFGREARTVVAMIDADPELGRPLVPGLPYLQAEALYSARYEMAATLDDVLARRTRALLLDASASAAAADGVARVVAPELGWSPARCDAEARAFRDAVEHTWRSAGLRWAPPAAAPSHGAGAGAGAGTGATTGW